MKLNQVLEAANGQICGGTEFMWECYGPNARYLELADIDGTEVCNIVFDSKDQTVYEIEVFVDEDDVAYRWINPMAADLYFAEAEDRNIDACIAYDSVKYATIMHEEEILDLVHKIVHKTYVHEKPRVEHEFTFSLDTPPDATIEDEHASEGCDDIRQGLASGNTEYEVKLNVMHVLSVNAGSMEEAICKAKKFSRSMKPGDYPQGVGWMDSYVAKESVSRDLATESIEE